MCGGVLFQMTKARFAFVFGFSQKMCLASAFGFLECVFCLFIKTKLCPIYSCVFSSNLWFCKDKTLSDFVWCVFC